MQGVLSTRPSLEKSGRFLQASDVKAESSGWAEAGAGRSMAGDMSSLWPRAQGGGADGKRQQCGREEEKRAEPR